ncbi:hypothetical protein [Streptomyces phytohabitans]|uniref:hypothetical protein n=1 Tax=Streptomyces phytohabitans TaxID=1150371 RepID=UPI00345BD246
MSFEEEWAQRVANARSDKTSQTRLNSSGDGESASTKKLDVTPSVLRERAGKSENRVAKEFIEAQRSAADKADQVPGSMKGFASDEALREYMTSWHKRVKGMKSDLGAEGLGGALRSAADSFGNEEKGREESFKPARPYKPGDIA